MNYIIMDMEWNQPLNPSKMVRSPVLLHGEIIQIGAFKTNENFELIDKIKINVRPRFYKKMNSRVRQITGITDIQLTAGETFPQAFRRFKMWCGDEFRFITWGSEDLSVLADNLKLHGLESDYGSDYINLQLIYNKQTNSEHIQCALSAAVEKLGIPLDVNTHDAFNDAYLTYKICRKLDMKLGIAEYADYAAELMPEPVFKDTVSGIADPKKMNLDKSVIGIPCTECGGKLKYREWIFGSYRSCKSIAECSECKSRFQVKFKATPVSEKNYTVIRSMFAAGDDDVKAFEEKLRKREERKKALAEKKANGNTGIDSDNI